jgi:hypothetical protein
MQTFLLAAKVVSLPCLSIHLSVVCVLIQLEKESRISIAISVSFNMEKEGDTDSLYGVLAMKMVIWILDVYVITQ